MFRFRRKAATLARVLPTFAAEVEKSTVGLRKLNPEA
jgi:hypothetical protein